MKVKLLSSGGNTIDSEVLISRALKTDLADELIIEMTEKALSRDNSVLKSGGEFKLIKKTDIIDIELTATYEMDDSDNIVITNLF